VASHILEREEHEQDERGGAHVTGQKRDVWEWHEPMVKLAEDFYVTWSNTDDAPTSYRLTSDDLRARGQGQALDELDERGFISQGRTSRDEFLSRNRGGPDGVCLTAEALARRWKDATSMEAFVLEPDDIRAYPTSEWHDNAVRCGWVPWRPDLQPDSLDGLTGADLTSVIWDDNQEQT
jgi:hypothetical protein